eukprot:g2255.t1
MFTLAWLVAFSIASTAAAVATTTYKNNTTCIENVKFCVPNHKFKPCTQTPSNNTQDGDSTKNKVYSVHSGHCCPCDLSKEDSAKQCFLNVSTAGATALYLLCLIVSALLTRLYIATGVREEEEEMEHVQKVIEYRKLYSAFGLEMNVDDYQQNAYDRNDLQFLRLHRILMVGQLIWIANPLATQMSNTKASSYSGKLTYGANFFTDTSSWLAKCVIKSQEKEPYMSVQTDFWFLLTIMFFVIQILLDMFITCKRNGCRNFGKSNWDDYGGGYGDHAEQKSFKADGVQMLMLKEEDVNVVVDDGDENKSSGPCWKGRCCNILRRNLRIAVLVYFVLYPLCMSIFIQGIACKNFTGDVNAIDGVSKCGTKAWSFFYCIVTLVIPFVGFPYLYYKLNCTKDDKMLDDNFLHDWGYLVIGYKRKMVLWPMVDFFELSAFLLFYYLQLVGIFNFFTRMLLNLISCYCKLVMIETFRPFESSIIYNTAINGKRILVVMFLATLVRIIPQIPDDEETKLDTLSLCQGTARHTISSYIIWTSYFVFFLLILLCFFDYWYNGLVFEWVRRKLRRLNGEKEVDGDNEVDPYVSEFLKLEGEYRIPSDQLKIQRDDDSDPIYLGAGGFGSVYKATWAQDQAYPVAAKELNATKMEDPNEKEDFVTEVKNLIMANHRNVINFYGICEQMDYSRDADGLRRRYIVMEYAQNGSLESYLSTASKSYLPQLENLRKNKRATTQNMQLIYPLPSKRFLRWAMDIAAGLNYLNSKGMPHQDVKPHNILLDRYNTVKLCDLGFKKMKQVDDNGAQARSGSQGVLRYNSRNSRGKTRSATDSIFEERGTAQYKSPEAFRIALEEWGEKVDVWAYGVVLKRMASLRQPFNMGRGGDGVSISDIFKKLPKCELLPFDHFDNKTIYYVHPLLEDLIKLCLNINPRKRPSFEKIYGLLDGMIQDDGNTNSSMKTRQSNGRRSTMRGIVQMNPAFGVVPHSRTPVEVLRKMKSNNAIKMTHERDAVKISQLISKPRSRSNAPPRFWEKKKHTSTEMQTFNSK